MDKLPKMNENYSDSIKIAALKTFEDSIQSPSICVMALSSVLVLQVNSFFLGVWQKKTANHSSILKNAVLQPREEPEALNAPINLLFSCEGYLPIDLNSSYNSNNFVPWFVILRQGSSPNSINHLMPTQSSILSFIKWPVTDPKLARKDSEHPTKCEESLSSTMTQFFNDSKI